MGSYLLFADGTVHRLDLMDYVIEYITQKVSGLLYSVQWGMVLTDSTYFAEVPCLDGRAHECQLGDAEHALVLR